MEHDLDVAVVDVMMDTVSLFFTPGKNLCALETALLVRARIAFL